MEISNRFTPSRPDLFVAAPSFFTARFPSPESRVVSPQSIVSTIAERFESLLHQGGKTILETPVRLFSHIPFQHLKRSLGLLNLLKIHESWASSSPTLGRQIFLREPVFPRTFQNLIQGLKTSNPSLETSLPVSSPLAPPAQATETSQNQDSAVLESAKADLQQKIDTPEPEIQQKLNDLNAKRSQEGKAPIDFANTTQEIESIMDDPALSDKQKKDKIGEMRKKLGLSKKDMKKLFTKRLAKIYQEAVGQIKAHVSQREESVKEAEKLYGKDSPQAISARERLSAAQNQLEPTLKQWEHQANLYKSMFPSFWSKIGGFFKKIGKGLLKVGRVFSKIMNFVTPFLRFVPGIGQMVAFGWGALKGLVQAVQGNWKGFLSGLFNFAQGIPGVGNVVSALSSMTSKALPIVRGLFETAKGNFTDLLQWGGNLLQRIPGIAPFLTKTSDYLSYLISPFRQKTDPFREGVPPGT